MFQGTSKRLMSAAIVLLSAVGCGDSGTGPEGSLTQAEAMAVFGEIISAVFEVQGGADMSLAPAGVGPVLGLAPSPAQSVTIDIEIDESVPCEEGGSILVDGAIEMDLDESETGTYSFSFVQKPNGCVVTSESGPKYEVDGNPGITMTGAYNVVEGELVGDFTMSFTGGLAWSAISGGANGSCTIDMDYVMDWETFEGSAEGRICGHNVSEQF